MEPRSKDDFFTGLIIFLLLIAAVVGCIYLVLYGVRKIWDSILKIRQYQFPDGCSKFVDFWLKSVETFPETRIYGYIKKEELVPMETCINKDADAEKQRIFVEFCTDNPGMKKMTCLKWWHESDVQVLASFNRDPAQMMSLKAIAKKIKKQAGLVDFYTTDCKFFSKKSHFMNIDKALAFYVNFKKELLAKLRENGLSVELPAVNYCKLLADEKRQNETRVFCVKPDRLHQKYFGVPVLVTVFARVHRVIARLFELESSRPREPADILCLQMKDEIQTLTVSKFLQNFQFPDQVVNGFWIYHSKPAAVVDHSADITTIYTPPLTSFTFLKHIQARSTLKFNTNFCVDPEAESPYRIVNDVQVRICGLVELDKDGSKLDSASSFGPYSPRCRHDEPQLGTWCCSACGNNVKLFKTEFIAFARCPKCGVQEIDTLHCFCEEDSDDSDSSEVCRPVDRKVQRKKHAVRATAPSASMYPEFSDNESTIFKV